MQRPTPSVPRATAEGRQPLPFPLRVAAIDVGSNAFRFIAAEFSDPNHYVELASERVPVRLGHSAFLTGELSASAIDRTVEGFRRFREEIDRLGIEHVRAVATSAVRESRNGSDLVRRVAEEAGIRLDLISGTDEARLVWMSVKQRTVGGPNHGRRSRKSNWDCTICASCR